MERTHMPSEFRFLVMCLQPMNIQGIISIGGVVNTLAFQRSQLPFRQPMWAMLGLILRRGMEGKHLDLMAFRLDRDGKPVSLEGFAGKPLILPNEVGAVTLPGEVQVPLTDQGVHGFYLFDRDGAFGPKADLLATYLYGVTVHE